MHQEHVSGGEVGHQIFGTTAQARDGLAFEARDEVLLERKPQIFAPDLGLHNARTLHGRLQGHGGRSRLRVIRAWVHHTERDQQKVYEVLRPIALQLLYILRHNLLAKPLTLWRIVR